MPQGLPRPPWRIATANACALLACAASLLAGCDAWQTLDAEAVRQLTVPVGDTFCVTFSPYQPGHSPGHFQPAPEQVGAMLDGLLANGRVNCILIFGTLGARGYVPSLARARNLKGGSALFT
jgi:hypothetical protein